MIWNILYDMLVSLEDFIKSVRCAHSIKWYLARLGLRIADRTLNERFTYWEEVPTTSLFSLSDKIVRRG